jgi:uncharacterized protein YkwD
MQRQNEGERSRRGISAAIAVMSVILFLVVLYFCYWIFYPSLYKFVDLDPSGQMYKKYFAESIKNKESTESAIKDKEAGYIASLGSEIIRLTNEERKKAGLGALKANDKAKTVAEHKVLEMSELNYFEHDSPKYGKIDNQFLQFGGIRLGADASVIGENLAMFEGYSKKSITAEEIVTAWMNSPEHKENILKKEYNQIGVSVYYTSDGKCYAAQEFLQTT